MRFRTLALGLALSVGLTGLVQAAPKKSEVSHPKGHKPKKIKPAKRMKTAKAAKVKARKTKVRKAKPAKHVKG